MLNFIINEIFGQGAIFLALIAMIGLLLQKKPATEVIRGTLMTAIGFFVLNTGTGLITGKSIDGLAIAFSTMMPQAAANSTSVDIGATYGTQIGIVMLLAFAINLLFARFTKWKSVFLTGHMLYWFPYVFIAAGVDEMSALRMVTLTPAEYFKLDDRGAIAPGRIADMLLLGGGLKDCEVKNVWKRGVMTVAGGKLLKEITPAVISPLPGNRETVRMPSAEDLAVRIPNVSAKLRMIGTQKDSVVTQTLVAEPLAENGFAVADALRGIAKIAVVEKNRGTGRTAIGFIKDLGITKGAVASSVAHDAHNFTCVGMDDESMAAALARLSEMGGGIVAAEDGEVIFSHALPVGGLMSLQPFDELLEALAPFDDAVAQLGCADKSALMRLSFMSLSVIPALKLTDRGYFDISDGGPKELFVK